MPRRVLSETGYYHVCVRSAGQIALFEEDADRKRFLALAKSTSSKNNIRILAWVLMTDHVHLILDCGEQPETISLFMHDIKLRYSHYFNERTGRSGTFFDREYWSKPIKNNDQLIATVYYIHMNPESAGLARMREYRWSSYQEYAGLHWMVDTSTILELSGGFELFDAYSGSPKDVVCERRYNKQQDGDVLTRALTLANLSSSTQLRSLSIDKRDSIIEQLYLSGATQRQIARTFGIGATTVSRILSNHS